MGSVTFIMGGTGFIGAETVKSLVARGDTVYGLARSKSSEEKLKKLGAIPIPGDVYEPDKWINNLPDIDYVINVLGFFNDGKPARLSVAFAVRCRDKYIKWAEVFVKIAKIKNVKAAIHVTGTTIFEDCGVEWVNESTPVRYIDDGFNRIAALATKLMVEEIKKGMPIIVAVAPNVVYGDVAGASFEQVFVDSIRSGLMAIVGAGTNYIPTGHVEDVGAAIAHVTDVKYAGEFFLISGDDNITQKEFMNTIAKGLNKKSMMHLPKEVVAVLGGRAAAEFMSLSQRVDNTKLKSTGFKLKHPRYLDEIPKIMSALTANR